MHSPNRVLAALAAAVLLVALNGCLVYVKGPLEPESRKVRHRTDRTDNLRPYLADISFTGNYVEAKAASTPPIPVKQVEPKLPFWAKENAGGSTLRAVVYFIVKTDGTTDQVQVKQADDITLIEPAIDALKQWEFKPATVNGVPVDCVGTIILEFQAKD